jgi:hypothetical protein
MFTAMLLAHLIGDYVLQWDRLAYWKSREVKGAVAHGGLVLIITALFAVVVDPAWWAWALFIGVAHIVIDGAQPWLMRRVPKEVATRIALPKFLFDQLLHFSVIGYALVASGQVPLTAPLTAFLAEARDQRALAYVLGYVFLSMPTWILVEFLVYGLLQGSAPDFTQVPNKYVGALERGLITTFVVLGQFALVPLATLPRLFFEAGQVRQSGNASNRARLYVAELLASILLAIVIGLGLKAL